MKMSETIRVKDSIQNAGQSSIQDVDQTFEDDYHDQLLTFERSSLHDASKLIDYCQIESKTSDLIEITNRQIGLKESRHQKIDNSHTDIKTSLSFDRFQRMRNLHTDMKESQSLVRQSSHSFRTSQSFQSAISTTKLFSLSRKKRSLFKSVRSLVSSLIESTRSNEPRCHSVSDLSRVEIRSSLSSLMKRINEDSTEQILLKIIDIFERLNIANKIEKVKEIVKEKDKTKKQQFKSSKSSSSRSIESSDLNSANIIENKKTENLISNTHN